MSSKTQINNTKKLNKARSISYFFLVTVALIFVTALSLNKEIGKTIFFSLMGLVLIFNGTYWGIYLKYIPGNFRGSDFSMVSTGIKGRKAILIGSFLVTLGTYFLIRSLIA